MLVMVAGPYSAPTEAARAENLAAMNRAAALVLARGHVPVIGVNAALPVLEAAGLPYSDAAMTAISLALAERCDAVLHIGRSPGAEREVEVVRAKGGAVFTSIADLPSA